MSVRLLAAVTVAALLVAPTVPAGAGVLCKQINDATGDARLLGSTNTTGQFSYSSLDIVSADVATGKSNLVAALRLKTLSRDTTLVGGATYRLNWTVNGTNQQLTYITYGSGTSPAWFFDAGNGIRTVNGTVDATTIYWTVPRSAVTGLLKKTRVQIKSFTAEARTGVNFWPPVFPPVRESVVADTAMTTKAYTDLTATCLKGA